MILGVLFAILISGFLIRALVRPVQELTRAANDVASGNLSARVTPHVHDEFGELAVRFNEMVTRLRSLMNQKDVIVSELSQKMSRAEHGSLEKSEFLSRLSYEFRIPLTTMIGYAEVLHDELQAEANEAERKRIIENILEAGQVLLHLVDEVVMLADMQSGRIELEMKNERLEHVITMTRDVCQKVLEEAGIQLIVKNCNDSGSRVYVDMTRLTHAFCNIIHFLVSNMSRPRDIQLECERRSDTRLRLNFFGPDADVNEADVASLFHVSRYRKASSLKASEAAMDLVIARKMIELMDGRVGATVHDNSGLIIWAEFDSI